MKTILRESLDSQLAISRRENSKNFLLIYFNWWLTVYSLLQTVKEADRDKIQARIAHRLSRTLQSQPFWIWWIIVDVSNVANSGPGSPHQHNLVLISEVTQQKFWSVSLQWVASTHHHQFFCHCLLISWKTRNPRQSKETSTAQQRSTPFSE